MMKISTWISLILSTTLQANEFLPPELPWEGASVKIARPVDDPWATPAEVVNFKTTPDYNATIKWLKKLVDSSDLLAMKSIGQTDEGRQLWLVIGAEKPDVNPAKMDGKKPTLFFHAGIHSGEIDGKDAGMMFLRDIVQKNPDLLKKLNLLFIPVLSPDGHENKSKYNRVNQRGPEEMGWRTNARNLNLNRDFTKLETPEVRALVEVLNSWTIDLYMDFHVTDGLDYQYDITFGYNDRKPYSPKISAWLDKYFKPSAYQALQKFGHIPGPLIMDMDNLHPEAGLYNWRGSPRYSNAYGDVRHLPTILVENHSLKNYKQRVLGSYVLLDASAKKMSENGLSLRAAATADKASRMNKLPMGWEVDTLNKKPERITILGVEYEKYDSPISGIKEVRWLGKPKRFNWPYYTHKAKHNVTRPTAYWIPPTRSDIVEKLINHGIEVQMVDKETKVKVEIYQLEKPLLADKGFEGRVRIDPGTLQVKSHEKIYPKGSAIVSTDQPLGDLAVLLLEPYSEDSFLQWGYFHEILQRTEYIENYVVEPMAQKMLHENPLLKKEWEEALKDTTLANNPGNRLHWFYKRSPYHDPNHLVYPIARQVGSLNKNP